MADQKFETIRQLKEIFIAFKTCECNGYDPVIENWKKKYYITNRQDSIKIWEKAADLCLEFNMDPEIFVELAFENCKKKRQLLMQYMLTGNIMRQLCERYKQEEAILIPKQNTEEYVDSCLQFVNQVVAARQNTGSNISSDLFLSTAYAFPAWIRIIFGGRNNPKIIQKYMEKAKEELKAIPNLEKVLLSRNIDISTLVPKLKC